jgi:hypothetical protein
MRAEAPPIGGSLKGRATGPSAASSFLRRIVLGLPGAGRSQRLIRHLVDCDATTCSYEA